MPIKTIKLRCDLDPNEILILRAVHEIEPTSSYTDPSDGIKYLVFKDDKDTNEILFNIDALQKYLDCDIEEGIDILREYLLGRVGLLSYDDTIGLKESI